MTRVGKLVRYGQSGVCREEKKCFLELGGQSREYYVLAPLYKTEVVYVPCENEALVEKMVPLLTEQEIEEVLQSVKSTPAEWIRDFRRRSDCSKKALLSGDRTEALKLIKNIYVHRRTEEEEGKRIHTTDDYFLKDAQMLIYSEFSHVWNKSVEETAKCIETFLEL